MSSDKVPQTIRFEEKTFKKLEELAKSDYTSVNSIVNRIVENYLKETLNEVAERSYKYTLKEVKEALDNDTLRAEILTSSPREETRLLYQEIQELKKKLLNNK